MNNTNVNTAPTKPEAILSAIKKYMETPVQELFIEDNEVSLLDYGRYGIDPDKPTPLYVLMDELVKDIRQGEIAVNANDPSLFPERRLINMFIHLSASWPDAAPEFFSIRLKDFFGFMCARADRKRYEEVFASVLMLSEIAYDKLLDCQCKPPRITPDSDFNTVFSNMFSFYELGCLLLKKDKKESHDILEIAKSMTCALTVDIYSAIFERTDSGIAIKPLFLDNTSL